MTGNNPIENSATAGEQPTECHRRVLAIATWLGPLLEGAAVPPDGQLLLGQYALQPESLVDVDGLAQEIPLGWTMAGVIRPPKVAGARVRLDYGLVLLPAGQLVSVLGHGPANPSVRDRTTTMITRVTESSLRLDDEALAQSGAQLLGHPLYSGTIEGTLTGWLERNGRREAFEQHLQSQ